MAKETLRKECKICSNTIAKLGKWQNVTTDMLIWICIVLGCDTSDIIEVVKEKESEDKEKQIL